MKLLIIDADYNYNRLGEAVIRLYGKKVGCSEEGKDIILHAKNFEPYFYVNTIWYSKNDIENLLKDYIKRIECVEKYNPIGYQTKKREMLKIILKDPKSTPACRKLLEENEFEVMEADVLFKNRFLNDLGISGMSIIEFNHVGTELKNYGLNCNELYIVDYEDIKKTDEKVNIEY